MSTFPKTRILVLGGGFGGLYAALYLDKTFVSDPNVEVTLVSRENYALFTPMLHEVAAGDLEMTDIVSPLRQMLKHVNFIEADVEAIDLAERQVTLAYGLQRQQKKLSYDHLLIALGSESNFFKKDWPHSYWRSNYARLASVKKKYDQTGLFFVHNSVGSEEWSADCFTKL